MKKISKVIAVFLSLIVFASAFVVASSAISPANSKNEILTYYENCNISTSAKEDVIKAEYTHKISSSADLSGLTERDKKETIDSYGELDCENETKGDAYFYGDEYKDYYVNGRSRFIDYFSIKRDIRRRGLTLKSGTYKVASNGEETVEFVSVDTPNLTHIYTAKIDKNGYIQSYTYKWILVYTLKSARGKEFKNTEICTHTYDFVYKEVAVTGIKLPKKHIKVGVGEKIDIDAIIDEAIIYPANATYTGMYADTDGFDSDVVEYIWEPAGDIATPLYGIDRGYFYGVASGTTTIKLYTYDGEFMAELKVTVTDGSFFDAIIDFFRSIFEFFRGFLMF